jgi:hypothetical protein
MKSINKYYELNRSWSDFLEKKLSEERKKPIFFITLITNADNKESAKKSFSHFHNKLQRIVYGFKWKNRNFKVSTYPVIERNSSGYYHFHLIVCFNEHDVNSLIKTKKELKNVFERTWLSMKSSCRSSCKHEDWCKDIKLTSESISKLSGYVSKSIRKEVNGEFLLEYFI